MNTNLLNREERLMRFATFGLAAGLMLVVACTAAPAAPTPTTAPRPTVAAAPKPAATTAGVPAQTVAPAAAAQTAATSATPQVVKAPVNAAGAYDPNSTLILYGDIVLFAGQQDPENCTAKSRFKRGEPVGFRATAVNPATGTFAEGAQLTVKLATGEALQMNYRGTGASPRPGFWTVKWVVPDSAPVGVMRYTIDAKDDQGRTGVWAPYDIASSILTIVQ